MYRQLQTLVILSLLLLTTVSAQVNTSAIAGVVKDESGSVIPSAKVVATLPSTGQQRETITNAAGEYVIPQLSPGTYRVNVTAPGFQGSVVQDLSLNIAERAVVNVSLRVGQVTGEITVTASTPLLEQETSSLSQVITQKTLIDLPLNGRNYLTLGALSPGVMPQL